MTKDEIYSKLHEIFADIFMRDDLVLSPTLTARDVPGWDSFRQIEIIMSVEERFGIKLQTRDMDRLANVGDLVAVIEAKLA
jgi:acyl carrier protein